MKTTLITAAGLAFGLACMAPAAFATPHHHHYGRNAANAETARLNNAQAAKAQAADNASYSNAQATPAAMNDTGMAPAETQTISIIAPGRPHNAYETTREPDTNPPSTGTPSIDTPYLKTTQASFTPATPNSSGQ